MKWRDIWDWSPWAAGFLAGSLLLTDCFGGHTEHVTGIVEGHRYTPPYTTLSCSTDSNGHTSCHTVYHDASYDLLVRSKEGLAWVSTGSTGYALVHDTEMLTYSRLRTRWTDYTWGNSYSPQ